jgi:transposase
LNNLQKVARLLADKAYDADWMRKMIEDQDYQVHIPAKSNRLDHIRYNKRQYKSAT